MKDQMQNVEVEIVVGQQKSEFAVFVDDTLAFSRLEQRRFPELDDLLEICQTDVEL
ncbi:MAG: Rdx family protein [Desulfuromonadales bacterium]|nr:Rdx family protein [Desulfuromonadales bacterium]